jgi:hypothetical protein
MAFRVFAIREKMMFTKNQSSTACTFRLNGGFRASIQTERVTAVGRSATDLPLQSCHSARRNRDRRHPANLDPLLSIATGSSQEL